MRDGRMEKDGNDGGGNEVRRWGRMLRGRRELRDVTGIRTRWK